MLQPRRRHRCGTLLLLLAGSSTAAASETLRGTLLVCHQAFVERLYISRRYERWFGGVAYLDRGSRYELRYRSITFYTARYELKVGADGAFEHIPVPGDANIGTFADQLLITLRSPWLDQPAGAMLAAPVAAFMQVEVQGAPRTTLS